jgi:hypothetical protein
LSSELRPQPGDAGAGWRSGRPRLRPSPVFFRIGYNSDKPWWQNLDNRPRTIGRAIAQRVRQTCGIVWVDFSLREVFKLPPE